MKDFDRGYVAGLTEAIELLQISASLGKNVKAEIIALKTYLSVKEGGTNALLDEARAKDTEAQ